MSQTQIADSRVSRVAGARALELALIIALWVEGLLGLLRLLGPFELGLGSERVTQHIPITLRLAASLELLVPTWLLGGNHVHLTMNVANIGGAQAGASGISWSVRALLIGGDLLRTATVLAVTFLLLLMVRSLRAGDPFTESNSRRIVWVALLVAIGGQAAVLMDVMAGHLVVSGGQSFGGWGQFPLIIDVHPLAYGLVLAVIAAVFRHGVALRREVEGLV
jgi:Protein of unknown function (DUF2975)